MSEAASEPVITPHPSPNWDERGGASIDLIVLHYTGMADGVSALRRLCDRDPRADAYADVAPLGDVAPETPLGRVSAHYLVDGDGETFQLVEDAHRAWHAGVASWGGQSDINARSIGVEIVNGGHDYPGPDGVPPAYAETQMTAVCALVDALTRRWSIAPWRVVGHSDVAADRKRDPGEHFPWDRLEEAGLAVGATAARGGASGRVLLRPGAAGPKVVRLQTRLAAWGYGLSASGGFDARTAAVIQAFQARFRGVAARDGGSWTDADEAALDELFMRARGAAFAARRAGRELPAPPDDPAPDAGR